MHITVLTLGSRGDVQPFIALAIGLRQAGHSVRIATHSSFEAFVRGYGFDFAPMPGDPREMLTGQVGQDMANAKNPITFLHSVRTIERQLAASLLEYAIHALSDTDAVIYSTLAFIGGHVAESLGIPAIAVHLQPMSKTAEFPNILFPQSLPHPLNRATHTSCNLLVQQAFYRTVRSWRQTLGLSKHTTNTVFFQQAPTLYAYSAHVIPKPADWKTWHHVTGFWFLDAPSLWQPPSSLEAFLADGPPPVCVTFGSMGSKDPLKATRIVSEALDRTGHRGILIGGWGGFDKRNLPDNCYLIDEIPHDWLFPKCFAVVSHGGAGTTAATLRAGIPAILIPTGMDQPFWAHRIAQLGVGPSGIARKKLDADRLSKAIRAVSLDPGMQKRAATLGKNIREERGVEQAVDCIERIIGAKAQFATTS